jgi:hypothetical protein
MAWWITIFLLIGYVACYDINQPQGNENYILMFSILIAFVAYTYFGRTIIRLTIVLFALYALIPRREAMVQKKGDWQDFKQSIVEKRVAIPAEGPIPFPEHLNAVESWYDWTKTVLKEEYLTERGFKMTGITDWFQNNETKALIPIGLVYDAAAHLVYSASPHNLWVGLVTRVLVKVPVPNMEAWNAYDMSDDLVHIRFNLEKHLPEPICKSYEFRGKLHEWKFPEYDDYLKRFEPPKRALIEKVRLCNSHLDEKQLCYNIFVKREKQTLIKKLTDFIPGKPRIISGVSFLSKALCGFWFYVWSKALAFTWNAAQTIWYCNGAQAEDFTEWMRITNETIGPMDDLVFVGTDFSKYDLTQGLRVSERQHRQYCRAGFLKSGIKDASLILKSKLVNYMYSAVGKFKAMIRMSGDHDTSSGNSENTGSTLLDFFVTRGYIVLKSLESYEKSGPNYKLYNVKTVKDTWVRIIVLGDDNFSVIHKDKLKEIHGSLKAFEEDLTEYMTKLGFVIKILVTEKLAATEFLSSKFYRVGNEVAIGKKPGRVITRMGWFLQKQTIRTYKQWMEVLNATMVSLLPTSNHVPFLRLYVQKVYNWTSTVIDSPFLDYKDVLSKMKIPRYAHIKEVFADSWKHIIRGTRILEPTEETWEDFHDAYGLTAEDEKIFGEQIDEALELYGLPCIVSSDYVDIMIRKEDVL